MVFTHRYTVGFILLLIASNPLESASAWRQARQIKTTNLPDSTNKSSVDNATDASQKSDNKLAINKLVTNETNKNVEILTVPKTENSSNSSNGTLKELDLVKSSSEDVVKVKKGDTDDVRKEEEPEKKLNNKIKDDRSKEKFSREESSRSIDVDIEKFTSSDFHNKNNVYTLPVSPDIEKYVNTDYEMPSTTESTYMRYASDFSVELTTPKNEYFDLKHRQIEEGVQQNLEEMQTYFRKKAKEENISKVDTESLLNKVNDTNVQLDYKSFTNINQNKSKEDSSNHEDRLIQKGTNLYFNETFNETKIIDEQNVIPITGPDYQLNKEKSLIVESPSNIKEKELSAHSNLTDSSAEEVSVVNNVKDKANDTVKSQKPIALTTDKPTSNLLTKPPTLNKTSSLISNKIEVEKIKPIELDKIKLSLDSSKKVAKDTNATTNLSTVENVTEVTTLENTSSKPTDLQSKENRIFKPISTLPDNETATEIFAANSSEGKTLIPTALPVTTVTTSSEKITTTVPDFETTVYDTKTTEATTLSGSSLTDPVTELAETTTVSDSLNQTTTIVNSSTNYNEITSTDTSSTVDGEEPTQSFAMMSDATTETQATQDMDTTMTSITEVSTESESTTSNEIAKNAITKASEGRIIHWANATEDKSEESLKNATNEIMKSGKNSTVHGTEADLSKDLVENSDEDYSDAASKTNNDIMKLFPSTSRPSVETSPPVSRNNSFNKNNAPSDDMPTKVTIYDEDITTSDNLELPKDENDGKVIAIVISCVGAVCLIALVVLLVIMRKRQKRFNYGQRCTPVSLDDYSMDNVSVYNSVRRKGVLRVSKRSYGNPAFDDPSSASNQLNFPALGKFADNVEEIRKEFDQIPQVTTRTNELPEGCELKNRYANVIPLPETRVFLNTIENYPNSEYINANYVTGPRGVRNYYIACQAPMQNTVEDFWRMIWEQQSKVVLMLTHIFENGAEKCYDYLPPSEVTDCQRLFGDLQVTLKRREVKTKYIISTIQLKNMVSNSWREITHLWYIGWPEKGVPEESNSIITFLIEARSYLKIAQNTGNNNYTMQSNGNSSNHSSVSTSPMVVHCSPGTGRTGTVIACDIAIREFELTRQVDIPKIVYKVRRDRASSVQTRDQYDFIYKVISLYATKLTGGGLDSI